MNIFTLMGTILVDNTKANESLDKTSKEADSMMGKIGKGIGTVAKVGVAVGGAVIAAGTAMGTMVLKSTEAAASIEKFSKQANTSTEEYQRLDAVMKNSGWSMEQAAGDFSALSEKIMETTEGSGEAYDMFQKLGVETVNLDGSLRNTGDVFNDTVMALQNVSDETERSAMASILLGTTGEELAGTLNMTNEEFLKMKENVNVIDEEKINKAQEFTEIWNNLKTTFSNVATELGLSLMPIFTTLMEVIMENMPQIKSIIEITLKIISTAIEITVDLIGGLIIWIQNLTDKNTESGKIIADLWEAVKEMMKKTFDAIKEIIETFTQIAKDIWSVYGDEISAATKAIWGIISAMFTTAFNTINNLLDIFTALFKGDWEGLWTAVEKLVSDIWDGITKAMKAWLEGMVKIVGDVAKDMFNAGKKAMDNFFEGLKEPWKKIENWLNEKLGWVDRQFGKADTMGTKAQDSKGKTVNGSHANGLEYVPFDGYIAELHQGERVLTAEEARRRDTESRSDTFNITIDAKNVKEFNDIVEMAKEERRLRRMGEEAS